MRFIAIVLASLLVLIQYPLWLGKGGWLRVWDMQRQVDVAHAKVQELKERNTKLASEVNDLKEGTDAVEERALNLVCSKRAKSLSKCSTSPKQSNELTIKSR